MKARLLNKSIIEILIPVPGFEVEDCFHPSIIAQCVDVADDVQVGWVQQEDGSFLAPPVQPTPEVPA